MDVACFSQFLVFTLIYHVHSAYSTSSPANEACQLCPHNLTQCLLGNITVQISSKDNCNTTVNMNCDTNLSPNLIGGFEWQKDLQKLTDKLNQSIVVQRITNKVTFSCTVLSPCGNFNSSSYKIDCPNNSTATVLLICGVGAIFVILMFGITMKIMLRRGEVQRQAWRQQRQAMQSKANNDTVISSL